VSGHWLPMSESSEPLHILIVDDDPGVRHLLTILFEREGWNVVTAADGEAAVEQIARARPDVILLDLIMPKRNGLEVLEHLIRDDQASAERVVVLTAVSETQLRRLPSNLPVWQIIRKPFDNDQLMQSVKACGRRRQSTPEKSMVGS
jgi:DNA-binding response OmpR family regulator